MDEQMLPVILKELVENRNCKTKSLKLETHGGYLINHVDPELLGKAAAKLLEIRFGDVDVTPVQAIKVFEAIASPESKLETLIINSGNLKTVSPDVLATAVKRLKELILIATSVTEGQKEKLFQTMQDSRINLNRLNFTCNQLTGS